MDQTCLVAIKLVSVTSGLIFCCCLALVAIDSKPLVSFKSLGLDELLDLASVVELFEKTSPISKLLSISEIFLSIFSILWFMFSFSTLSSRRNSMSVLKSILGLRLRPPSSMLLRVSLLECCSKSKLSTLNSFELGMRSKLFCSICDEIDAELLLNELRFLAKISLLASKLFVCSGGSRPV